MNNKFFTLETSYCAFIVLILISLSRSYAIGGHEGAFIFFIFYPSLLVLGLFFFLRKMNSFLKLLSDSLVFLIILPSYLAIFWGDHEKVFELVSYPSLFVFSLFPFMRQFFLKNLNESPSLPRTFKNSKTFTRERFLFSLYFSIPIYLLGEIIFGTSPWGGTMRDLSALLLFPSKYIGTHIVYAIKTRSLLFLDLSIFIVHIAFYGLIFTIFPKVFPRMFQENISPK